MKKKYKTVIGIVSSASHGINLALEVRSIQQIKKCYRKNPSSRSNSCHTLGITPLSQPDDSLWGQLVANMTINRSFNTATGRLFDVHWARRVKGSAAVLWLPFFSLYFSSLRKPSSLRKASDSPWGEVSSVFSSLPPSIPCFFWQAWGSSLSSPPSFGL